MSGAELARRCVALAGAMAAAGWTWAARGVRP